MRDEFLWVEKYRPKTIEECILPEEEFKSIQSFMMGGEFRWFYAEGRALDDDGQYHMTHMFFQPEVGSNSEHINMWKLL